MIDMREITDHPIWQAIKSDSLEFEQVMDPLYRRQTGSYYTSLDLTLIIIDELIKSLDDMKKRKIYDLKFLEPCVGTGNFVFAYLFSCRNLGLSRDQFNRLLNNIYVCDINAAALEIYEKNLKLFARSLYDIELDDQYFSTHVANGLLFDLNLGQIEYIPISNNFGKNIIDKHFDIVVTNPPYKNLKAERGQYTSDDAYCLDKQKYHTVAKLAKKHLHYSTSGTLNLYKMFVEEILERYVKDDGLIALLLPASILTDKTCTNLRGRMLELCQIHSLRLIPETSDFVNAAQALCAMLLEKGKTTTQIRINGALDSRRVNNDIIVESKDVVDEKMNHTILILNGDEYDTRRKMCEFPKIKDLSYLHNLRGELDMTFGRGYITSKRQDYRLLRGRHVGYYMLNDIPQEYVQKSFLETTPKAAYCKQERLVCQQVVNIAKKRRVAFAIANKNVVLANSCNFITVDENDDDIDIYFLLGILNSSFIDWYFKLSSSNNHINNYEIDELPIPTAHQNKAELSNLVKAYIKNHDNGILEQIDKLVGEAYGIERKKDRSALVDQKSNNQHAETMTILERFKSNLSYIIPDITIAEAEAILMNAASCDSILLSRIPSISTFDKKVLIAMTEKYQRLLNNEVLNHTTFKLSDLDLEMIRNIPQGGNWQDIPEETIKKSQRLTTIAKTGGRTTLYGRIDYAKPSYTITTYFNRPGNGTYVHPVHNRVLSVREAARFQCFPDEFFFTGNKTDMLKQVGNAVPVMLAYNIGKSIRQRTGCRTSVDLFSGAGGMTYGFKLAGIHPVIANDCMESACVTLKTNCPEIPVLCGDVTDSNVKDSIVRTAIKHGADIICGGPPCQGFSLAGFRSAKDPRNQLFRDFIDIVSAVNPKVVVFENVPGLLSYKGGETYHEIVGLFSELGYMAEGRQLMANEYGAPQRRKRVIILCVRKDLNIPPAELYPDAVSPKVGQQSTAFETIFDLEKVECGPHARQNIPYMSPILKYLKGLSDPDDYLETIQRR